MTGERHGAQKIVKKEGIGESGNGCDVNGQNPDKYAAHLFLSSTHCAFAS